MRSNIDRTAAFSGAPGVGVARLVLTGEDSLTTKRRILPFQASQAAAAVNAR